MIMRVATFARCAGQRARTVQGPGTPSPPSKRRLRALISTLRPSRAASRRLGAIPTSYRFDIRDGICCLAQSQCVWPVLPQEIDGATPSCSRHLRPFLRPTRTPRGALMPDRGSFDMYLLPGCRGHGHHPLRHLHALSASCGRGRQCARTRPPIVCGTSARKFQARAQVRARILIYQGIYRRPKRARARVRLACGC